MLDDVVAEAARRFGARAAFVDHDGRPLSYTDLDRRSDAIAASLRQRGIRPGAVVALTLESTTAYVLAFLGAAKAGIVTAGVNPRLAAAERRACLDLVEPWLEVSDAEQVHELETAGQARVSAPLVSDHDRLVAVVFTSGTSGVPKAAMFTNRQLAAVTAIDVGEQWGDQVLPMLAATQFAHVGFMTKLAWYLRRGTTTHLLERWRPAEVLELIERERLETIGGVAPQIALLLRDAAFDHCDLSSVRSLVVGGGPSSPALVAEARRRFDAGYSIRYSSTESGGVGTGTALDGDDHETLHTVGRPRAGVEMMVVDDNGRPTVAGQVGEVRLRSAATMAGYWHDPAATAITVVGGWLRTGDLGHIDATGCLVLVGRSTEMFIRGGYNVYPIEVEAVLGRHPALRQVAVVPRVDEVMGEIGVAVVVPVAGGLPPTLQQLRAFASGHLASYKLPEAIHVVPDLPLTAMQKVDRRAIQDSVADDGEGLAPT